MNQKKQQQIAVIGGGASGMMAAIMIKKNLPNHKVTIFECQNKIGKKILQTGNGRCNLTNQKIDYQYYNHHFVDYALKVFDFQKCQQIFNDFGLILRSDIEGRVYPYSEKATTVIDILLKELNILEVEIITDIAIFDIRALDDFSLYSTDLRLYHADYVVMATGGVASINYQYHGYEILQNLGHYVEPVRAGLVALKTKEKTKSLSGIRIKGQVSLIVDQKIVYQTKGEILFKDQGLSGIAILDLSRFFDETKKCYLEIDLMPEYSEEELLTKLKTDQDLLGFFPKMINQDLIKRKTKDNNSLSYHLKHYRFTIISRYDFTNAQITIGGVSLEEVNPFTYQSLLIDNLYLIGEVLNIDGSCGGYNLHFAWASAYVASQDIIKKIKELN